MKRLVRSIAGLWLAVAMAGCPIERLAPGQVAMGVSRLTVLSMGNVVSITEADTRCGFGSEEVKLRYTEEGELGSPGSVTWTVENCRIELGGLQTIGEDCNGEQTQAAGTFTVSATKTVEGILTGNPDNPVVPTRADPATFRVTSVSFDGYQVRSANPSYMTLLSGSASFVVQPHLAVADSLGVCSIPTGDVTVSEIVYTDAKARVMNDGREFEVDIPSSNLSAQVGKWGEKENAIEGEVTVWDRTVEVPTPDDKDGLDPEYDAAEALAAVTCKTDLRQPLTYECPSLKPQLVQGAAALTVMTFGNLVSIVSADANCGFAAPSVNNGAQLSGEQGVAGGEAVWTISSPCSIAFDSKTPIAEDCTGVKTFAKGRVTVTGTKRVRGILTGDPAEPVVPTSRDPAEVTLQAIFQGFTISTSNSSNSLTVQSGALSGTLRPRLAKDTVTGACSIATPVVQFENLSYEGAVLLLNAEGNTFRMRADSSSLEAQSGSRDGRTNHLAGAMRIDGEAMTVPAAGGMPILDPEYDELAFAAGFACTPNMEIPADDNACDMTPTFAEGAGRLTVASFGAIVQAVEADTGCGFSSRAVQDNRVEHGELGRRGADVIYTIPQPCTVHFDQKEILGSDCLGVGTYVQGTLIVTGTKTIRGIRTGDPAEPIVPTSRDPAEITLNVQFVDFTSSTSDSENSLTLNQGAISGAIRPRLAIDSVMGACSIATPVVEFHNLTYAPSSATLNAGPKHFKLTIASGTLTAQNGTKGDRTNWLSGTLAVNGQSFQVPLDASRPVLNPDYDPAHFNAGFMCAPGIVIPTDDAQCNFKRTLGENSARLIIQTAGTITSMVNHDSGCGFENMLVLTSPDSVVGASGEMGSMSWSLQDCELGGTPAQMFEEDCHGGQLMVVGDALVDASRTVTGEREKQLLFIDSIIPRDREEVEVRLDHVDLTEFAAYNIEAETGEPVGVLTIHSGTLKGTLRPILGERASDPGIYDVSTNVSFGVSRLVDIQLINADVTLTAQGKTFNFQIGQSHLDAFNGTWQGTSNWLDGTIVIDGETVRMNDIPLNPHFEQAHFNEGYICAANLRDLIPWQ